MVVNIMIIRSLLMGVILIGISAELELRIREIVWEEIKKMELATKGDLNKLRADFEALRADVREEIGKIRADFEALRADVREEIGKIRADFEALRADFEALRADVREEIGKIREEIGNLRAEVHEMRAEIYKIFLGIFTPIFIAIVISLIKLVFFP